MDLHLRTPGRGLLLLMRALTLSEALSYGKGTERAFLCPVHDDSRPSASVNVVKKKWYCYTCGAHGGLTGEALLAEPDYLLLKRDLEERMEAEDRVYTESWLARYDAGPVHPYWVERFDEPTARRFRLGYDSDADAVTYPLRSPSGEVLGVVRRPLGQSDGPKYLYPRGIDISRLLFNYTPDARRCVVLVEGALDAVALSLVGVHAFAVYGSRLSRDQVRLIDRLDPEQVYTCFDADDAGGLAHVAAERAFKHRAVGRLRWPPSWGKDIDEVSLENRRRVVRRLLLDGLGCVECDTCLTANPARSYVSTSKLGKLRIKRKIA